MSEGPAWMRRSRSVAREFNWLESREDTFSPATSSAVVKLLPALAMSDGFIPNAVLGTLDISDAFLQVPQSLPRAVTINGCSHIILRCLPGQRDPCGCCLAKNSLAFCVSRTLQCFYCMWMMCFSWVMKSGSGILSFPNWKVSSR